jgi:hypothetical protein
MVGRIGNQLFQIANAYSQAKTHNRELILPLKETNVEPYITNVYRNISSCFTVDRAPIGSDVYKIDSTFHLTQYTPHATYPTAFKGFFQSEKYFIKHVSEIKNIFEPTEGFLEKAVTNYPFLKNKIIAAINVRRGDYLNFPTRHPVISLNYIYEAVKHLPKVDYYLIVSDDIQWCKENIKLPNSVFAEYTDYEALWLLSLCHHFVISNSSFSWWGAYLSKNTNKIVIAPDTWVGPDIVEDMKDIWCEGWIKIPTQVYNGYLEIK